MTKQNKEIRGEVNLLDAKSLIDMAADTSHEGRVILAEGVAKFFERDLSENEKYLANDILLNLVRQAEIDLRQALAERLAPLDTLPVGIIHYLASDEITVARPVLLHSPVLTDVDLVYIIRSQEQGHWQAIAERPGLSAIVTDRLIETGHSGTIMNLLENQRTNLNKGSMKKLARAALRSEELQAPLLRRPEVGVDVAIDLYLCVSEALRREISKRFRLAPDSLERALDDLVRELCNEAKGQRQTTPDMMSLAKSLSERNEITTDLLISTLRRGQIGFFIALLSTRLGIAPVMAVRVVEKEGGKPLAVASKWMAIQKSEFASLFLLSRSVRGGDKIIDQRELAMALRSFDTLTETEVKEIMQSWVATNDATLD